MARSRTRRLTQTKQRFMTVRGKYPSLDLDPAQGLNFDQPVLSVCIQELRKARELPVKEERIKALEKLEHSLAGVSVIG